MFGIRRRDSSRSSAARWSWPLAARAQQPASAGDRVLEHGLGFSLAPMDYRVRPATARVGWIEGRTVVARVSLGEGTPASASAEIAGEFVRLKVDVIVTAGSAVASAKQATSVIPIVFAMAIDPVAGGLVASLSRPGGNVTGLSNDEADLAGKRLELLREVRPNFRRLAILANVGNTEFVLEMRRSSRLGPQSRHRGRQT